MKGGYSRLIYYIGISGGYSTSGIFSRTTGRKGCGIYI